MTIVLLGSSALISWKFLTEASLTRPLKFRHQHRKVSFQCGGLFLNSMPLGDEKDEDLRGLTGNWGSVCEGVGVAGAIC